VWSCSVPGERRIIAEMMDSVQAQASQPGQARVGCRRGSWARHPRRIHLVGAVILGQAAVALDVLQPKNQQVQAQMFAYEYILN
jgi:hypothetical protein